MLMTEKNYKIRKKHMKKQVFTCKVCKKEIIAWGYEKVDTCGFCQRNGE